MPGADGQAMSALRFLAEEPNTGVSINPLKMYYLTDTSAQRAG